MPSKRKVAPTDKEKKPEKKRQKTSESGDSQPEPATAALVTTSKPKSAIVYISIPNPTNTELARIQLVEAIIKNVERKEVGKMNNIELVLYHWFAKGAIGDAAIEELEEYASYLDEAQLDGFDPAECRVLMDRAMLRLAKKLVE